MTEPYADLFSRQLRVGDTVTFQPGLLTTGTITRLGHDYVEVDYGATKRRRVLVPHHYIVTVVVPA